MLTHCPVETMAPPSETYLMSVNLVSCLGRILTRSNYTFGQLKRTATVISMFLVEVAGVEPASRTFFRLFHTTITYIISEIVEYFKCLFL